MDITKIIEELMIPIVVVGCFVVGYVAKKFMPTDNKWIPLIVTIVGAILACWIKMKIDPTIIIAGAVSGLASTGVHQFIVNTLGLDGTKKYERDGK